MIATLPAPSHVTQDSRQPASPSVPLPSHPSKLVVAAAAAPGLARPLSAGRPISSLSRLRNGLPGERQPAGPTKTNLRSPTVGPSTPSARPATGASDEAGRLGREFAQKYNQDRNNLSEASRRPADNRSPLVDVNKRRPGRATVPRWPSSVHALGAHLRAGLF